MKRYSFPMAFGLGLLALFWVAASVAASHPLVLAMTACIAAVYGAGAWELRQYRETTQALCKALNEVPQGLQNLNDWLITLPAGLQNPVRQRVEGERSGLPGPALTPYLVGLLVMLGMLGTFLGMVVTLNGAVFALEDSSNVSGIRAAFSEPIKGLGLAFGTSVAGVATSAMLGLMSSLARRERAQAAQTLDTLVHSSLREFSLTHQRQEAFQALQQQAQILPQLVQQMQTLMANMADTSQQMNARLLADQHNFHAQVHTAYTGLAQSVDQSLRSSLSQSLQLASESIRPVVQATLTELGQQAQSMNERLLLHTQQHLEGLHKHLVATTSAVAQTHTETLTQQAQSHVQLTEHVGQSLDTYRQTFERQCQDLLAQIGAALSAQQAQHHDADLQRLQAWQAGLTHMADTLHSTWQSAGAQTLAQQQAICDTLSRTAQDITTHSQTQATQTLADIHRLMASSEALMQERIATEAQWTAQHQQRAQELAGLLRHELSALRDAEEARGQAAVARLAELQTAVTAHLGTLGTALEEPIARLIESASQAPQAAAEVMGQLRQEISQSVARDNTLLEERARILGTLSTLLDAIQHASTEQRGVIDTLVSASQATLAEANHQFHAHVNAETDKLGQISAQVTASAVDVASLGETFAFAVRAFSESNGQLMAQLQRIEAAIDKSLTRSDEQLAFYVGQAREIIDLSIHSQQDVLEALQQRQAQGVA